MAMAVFSVSPVRFRVSSTPSTTIQSSKADGPLRMQAASPMPSPTPPSRSPPPTAAPPSPIKPVSQGQQEATKKATLSASGCKTCGKEELEKGCNGEGRIQGGIATVPGFGWWPIKAYRPCPGFVESGGRYQRRGQSMDEVAFGRGGKETS